jgi:LemA protein
MIFTLIVLVLGIALCAWYLTTYNSIVALRNGVEQSWSNIEVELKRRFDLIGNLISVAKGYADYEKETLEKIVTMRVSANQELSLGDARELQMQLGRAVTKLMAISEAYPDLKADKHFSNLQTELIETENRIAERRLTYNSSVNLYLNRKLEFPSSFVASLHEFPEKLYFDAPDEEVAVVPEVKLS